KPFSMRELMARVKALLRRVELIREDLLSEQSGAAASHEEPRAETITIDNLEIDLSRREVRLDGAAVRLKPKEFDLLLFLARNKGVALSRDLILERVWGWSFDGNSRTVDVHVRWLREKIEADPAAPERIITIRGV